MGEKSTAKRPPSLVLAPVPIEDQYKQPTMQKTTWLTLFTRWLQYNNIQFRWDIERWLARLLHCRWGL
jgi:hypothetical protein